MADDVKKTYTEDEHLAILSDRVSKETASLTAERDQLKTEKSEAETKLDVAESAKLAADQAKETADKALADYKAEVESREAAMARKDERIEKIREAAKHLDDSYFTEARVDRIVAMDEDSFAAHLTDLVDSAPPADGKPREIPRETAMKGKVPDEKSKVSAGEAFLLGRYIDQEG